MQYSTEFHNIRRQGGTCATAENPLDFGGNPNHVTLGLELGLGLGLLLDGDRTMPLDPASLTVR